MVSTQTTPPRVTTELPSDLPAAIRHAKTQLAEGEAAVMALGDALNLSGCGACLPPAGS
jgi:hypothetical protein